MIISNGESRRFSKSFGKSPPSATTTTESRKRCVPIRTPSSTSKLRQDSRGQDSFLSDTSTASFTCSASRQRRKHWAELLSMLSTTTIPPGILSTGHSSFRRDDWHGRSTSNRKQTASLDGGKCDVTFGKQLPVLSDRSRCSSANVNETCKRNLSVLSAAVKNLQSGKCLTLSFVTTARWYHCCHLRWFSTLKTYNAHGSK